MSGRHSCRLPPTMFPARIRTIQLILVKPVPAGKEEEDAKWSEATKLDVALLPGGLSQPTTRTQPLTCNLWWRLPPRPCPPRAPPPPPRGGQWASAR